MPCRLSASRKQKLWEAFRKPIDEASSARVASAARRQPLSAHDHWCSTPRALRPPTPPVTLSRSAPRDAGAAGRDPWPGLLRWPPPLKPSLRSSWLPEAPAEGEAEAAPARPAAPREVGCRCGDDCPGMVKAQLGRAGRPGDRGLRRRRAATSVVAARAVAKAGRGERGDRAGFEPRGPRLGDAAFRAQREAVEHAEAVLRKLAAQAHGEVPPAARRLAESVHAAAVPPRRRFVAAPATRVGLGPGARPAAAAMMAGERACCAFEMAGRGPDPG